MKITKEILRKAKEYGFSDKQLAYLYNTNEIEIRNLRKKFNIIPVYKTVDSCAAEFMTDTNYHYSTYETENEVVVSNRRKVMILGGGPNRIGQGIEFDYCCVHGVFSLKEEGFEVIMVNCNPETVSTDYDISDKLYFEPLTLEDVLNIVDLEKPEGVIITFGGQTPLKIAKDLEKNGVKILGTSPEGIDIAEDRKRFGKLLEKLKIPCPDYGTAINADEAISVAEKIGYPVLVRPSYVLGGRAMEICYSNDSVKEYMGKAVDVSPEHPVLIDRFLEDAFEFDVDAICDGEEVMIAGVMQHIEEAGIHSGDSACVLPPYELSEQSYETIVDYTKKIAFGLGVVGLINVQFAFVNGVVYVLEANPRASRTVPFVSKTIGVPLAKIAAKVMVGKKLKDLNIKQVKLVNRVAIKEAVLPFSKFQKVPVFLGPEMRSTGEVMGISSSFGESFAKSQIAAGNILPIGGTVFISVNNNDKNLKTVFIAKSFIKLGFKIIATEGTSNFLTEHEIENRKIFKANEGRPNVVDEIKNNNVQLIINTPLGRLARVDEFYIGRAAIENKIPFITTLSAAASAIKAIEFIQLGNVTVESLQDFYKQNN
jgi:carbamoyl-phosphate synthase large subunit